MVLEELIKIVESFDFEDVIKQESKEYLTNGYRFVPYQDKDDDKKFITNGLKRFANKNDKIIFLLEAINYLTEEKIEAEHNFDIKVIENFDHLIHHNLYDREHYQYHEGLKNNIKRFDAQTFYAVRELEKLGVSGLGKNAFSYEQVNELTRKINALLIKIDEITVGQEVIYNFINELKEDLKEMKSDFPLGKKRWYQRFSGIVASYLGHKGADTLYELIKPDIIKIIRDAGIERLLS